MINKKGNGFVIIFFFLILFMILIVGVIMALGSTVVNLVGDELTPVFEDLGVIDNTNMSEAAEYSVVPLNTVIQQCTWLTGTIYVLMLIFAVIFAVANRVNPSPMYIAFYVMLVLLLIVGSIIISNVYEELYDGGDTDIAGRLQEHSLLSYMILYSPGIMTLIAMITGIFIFSGRREEEYIA